MDKHAAAFAIITHALPLVPFDGWNTHTLREAAIKAGYKKTDVIRVFPGGAIEAVDRFFAMANDAMLEALASYNLESMKIRQRIALAVRLHIGQHEGHREALRKAVALQAMPFNTAHALKSLYATVDAIWHGIGDTSTDFNFYTKRLLLAGVYSSTLLYWLDDKSPGHAQSWAFLDRRIEGVMQIEKAKYQLKRWFSQAQERFTH